MNTDGFEASDDKTLNVTLNGLRIEDEEAEAGDSNQAKKIR